jgi:hypothetical protein
MTSQFWVITKDVISAFSRSSQIVSNLPNNAGHVILQEFKEKNL